jgi:hypothetical protein
VALTGVVIFSNQSIGRICCTTTGHATTPCQHLPPRLVCIIIVILATVFVVRVNNGRAFGVLRQ